ncbi:hypothetical protein BJ741DRAFT_638426 [Chytriomyces cf. hyalinus JEL632]|nr:hypothetical protein BJ741DRAFT_638426 [Chytriomyces cf. hyalinus JEL632]
MTLYSSHCPCCQRHALHVHSMQQRALNELNFYRELLQLVPLNSMDAFEVSTDNAIVEPAPCHGSITRSASFETMPPEILDRILQFVDDKSILSLCHSMPYYKYISAAMFDFVYRFPKENYKLDELWLDLHFPLVLNDKTKTTDFPLQHLHAAGVYSRIVSKNGGDVHVPCSKNVFDYVGALPAVVSVRPGDNNHSSSGWADFLRGLADANKRIQCCAVQADSQYHDDYADVVKQLTRLQIHSLIWREEYHRPTKLWDALPFIKGLSYLEVDNPEHMDENSNIFSQCLDLTEIAYTKLYTFEDSVSLMVDCILQRIKGTRIQRVWCARWSQVGKSWSMKDLKIMTSEFLKHGWHKEIHGTVATILVRQSISASRVDCRLPFPPARARKRFVRDLVAGLLRLLREEDGHEPCKGQTLLLRYYSRRRPISQF